MPGPKLHPKPGRSGHSRSPPRPIECGSSQRQGEQRPCGRLGRRIELDVSYPRAPAGTARSTGVAELIEVVLAGKFPNQPERVVIKWIDRNLAIVPPALTTGGGLAEEAAIVVVVRQTHLQKQLVGELGQMPGRIGGE